MSDFDNATLNKVVPPKPREVWHLDDEKVRLHVPGKKDKPRPVLVVSKECNELDQQIINVIPLTTKRDYDKLTFPIHRCYEEEFDGFDKKTSSTAVIQFYQPIVRDFFDSRVGIIDTHSYSIIKRILCVDVIGYEEEYDFEL
jgi:uncharacterized protein YifN (PemK superfamily)